MTTVEQAYEKYLLKTEKNATNDGIATNRERFCLLFNESQNKYLAVMLQQRGVDDIRRVQKFLVLDKKILSESKNSDHYDFKLPEKYFDLADVRAKAEKGKCSDTISLFEIQIENLNEIIQDEYNKPSFEWRETFYTINSDYLSVYVDNFKISEILLNYYRYPNQIESTDESTFNENITIEWDEQTLDIVLSITAGESDLNQNNPRFQLQNARAKQ